MIIYSIHTHKTFGDNTHIFEGLFCCNNNNSNTVTYNVFNLIPSAIRKLNIKWMCVCVCVCMHVCVWVGETERGAVWMCACVEWGKGGGYISGCGCEQVG